MHLSDIDNFSGEVSPKSKKILIYTQLPSQTLPSLSSSLYSVRSLDTQPRGAQEVFEHAYPTHPDHRLKCLPQGLSLYFGSKTNRCFWPIHKTRGVFWGHISFLFRPIQDLFARQDLTIIKILEHLAILAVLYNDKVVGGTHGDWQRFCSADFSFLELLDHMDPLELAKTITDDDETCFLNLRPSDYLSKASGFRSLETRWNVLADTAKACCLALPDSIEEISKVVVVSCFALYFRGP